MINKKYGKLTTVALSLWTGMGKHPAKYYDCVCECGKNKRVAYTNLVSGATKSCGCLTEGINIKHGHIVGGKPSPTLQVYNRMMQRCNNKRRADYNRYGGCGIKVDSRWCGQKGFINFLSDMGNKPPGLSLGRIDVNSNFSPNNCRWMTASQRNSYSKPFKSNTSGVTGVSLNRKTGKWMVFTRVNGKLKCFGGFTKFDCAVARYDEVKQATAE